MSKFFVDTSYVLALSFSSDRAHRKAASLAVALDRKRVQLVTTRAVLLEIGNALSKQRYRRYAVEFLSSIEESADVVSLTDDLYARAFDLFRARSDKEWGLVDCVSCVVMREQNITQVLTADRHFQQMGFRALMLE